MAGEGKRPSWWRRLVYGDPEEPKLWREELKRAWVELRGANQSPARAAAAVALGTFIGSIPLYGTHTPLVLAVCVLLQLDAPLAWIASNISNPAFSVALITAEIQVGGYVLTGEVVEMHHAEASWATVREYGTFLFVGAPFVALFLAVVLSAAFYVLLRIKRRFVPAGAPPTYALPAAAPPWWHAAERVAGRYAPLEELSTPAERTRFNYVRVKLLMDPIAQMIVDLAGDEPDALGAISDVGCGRGQMAVMMLERGRATSAFGVDWDEEKVEAASLAAGRAPALPARFEVGDMKEAPIPEADTVLLIDVIHYLALEEQDDVLRRAARAVRPGGRVVVREADTERGWRSAMTLAEELIFTVLRFNRGARVKFRPARTIVAVLEGEGLSCEVEPAWGSTPFSNVLVVGRRPR